MLEDNLLVWRLQAGDKEALRRIYEKYKDELLTIASSLLNEPSGAEDVIHDVFVSFARVAERFRPYGSLRNYFITCVVNRVRDRFRNKMYQIVGLESTGPLSSEAERPDRGAIENEESEYLNNALVELPLHQREVIILHLQGGMKFREVAEVQDVSINTVQSRYLYGLDKLRSIIGREIVE